MEERIVLERHFEGGFFWVYKHPKKKGEKQFEINVQLDPKEYRKKHPELWVESNPHSVGRKDTLEGCQQFIDKVTKRENYLRNLLSFIGMFSIVDQYYKRDTEED